MEKLKNNTGVTLVEILLGIIIDIQAVGIYQFAKRLVEPINYLVVTFNPWLQSQLKTKPNEFKIMMSSLIIFKSLK